MKLIIQLVLWAAIIFFGWSLYSSITGTTKFNNAKEKKYVQVIAKLKDIKEAQLAHQTINGNFSGDWNGLVQFIDTAQFALTQRRDSSYADVEKNKAYGIDEGYFVDVIVVDTLGFKPVKDSLFGTSTRYKTMMDVPETDAKFELKAGTLEKNGTKYPVFEAKVAKEVILEGMDKDLIAQEKLVNSVDGVKGAYLKVGAMDDIDTSGNWPKLYDSAKDKQ